MTACFITQLIIGSIFVLRSFSVKPLSFGRDVVFYLLTIIWVFRIFLVQKQLRPVDAYGFLGFYFLYVLVALAGSRFEAPDEENEVTENNNQTIESQAQDQTDSIGKRVNCYECLLPIKPQSKGHINSKVLVSFILLL